ncbi:MAG: hypothetical protein SCK29_01295 [Bacillota bacterium]|nr:hypothetical protein [Bacillota bacterium]MDW7682735.1 hypothetical protein [Bacillota bacterium]
MKANKRKARICCYMGTKKGCSLIAIIILTSAFFFGCSTTEESKIEQIIPESVNYITMYYEHAGYVEKTVKNSEEIDYIAETLKTDSWEFLPNWDADWLWEFEVKLVGDDSSTFIGLDSQYARVIVDGNIGETFQIPSAVFDELYEYYMSPDMDEFRTSSSPQLRAAKDRIIAEVKSIDKEEVAATVNGVPIYHRPLLLGVKLQEIWHENTLNMYEDEELGEEFYEEVIQDIQRQQEQGLLASLLQERIRMELLYQEAVIRGLLISQEEAEEYAQQVRSSFPVSGNTGEVLIIHEITLASLEMTGEEYWEWAVNGYQKSMSFVNLRNELGEEETELLYQNLLDEANIEYQIDVD